MIFVLLGCRNLSRPTIIRIARGRDGDYINAPEDIQGAEQVQALRLFFSLPPNPSPAEVGDSSYEKFEINSILTLEGQEDSYVRQGLASSSIASAHAPPPFSLLCSGYYLIIIRPGGSTFYPLYLLLLA
jgi:hypothetical protein